MMHNITCDASWAWKTYAEIEEIASADGSILVIPVGSLEQHGYHLPVATDSLLVTAIAERGISQSREDTPIVITPTIWTGYSPHHLPFGGTVTLSARGFIDTLTEIASTALSAGFDALLLLNGHGGNIALIDVVTSVLGADNPDVEVLGLTYFHLAPDIIEETRESEVGGMGHGGEFETSLMLYLYPDTVDPDELSGTYMDEPYELASGDLTESGVLSTYRPFTAYSDSGAIGDPALATADKGERLYTAIGNAVGGLLEEIHDQNK